MGKYGAAKGAMLSVLTRILPGGSTKFQAKLVGVAGYTGAGDFGYCILRSGHRTYRIELRGIAGKAAEIYASDIKITQIPLNGGRAMKKFDTRRGDPTPALGADDTIEIRQNGEIILSGVLACA